MSFAQVLTAILLLSLIVIFTQKEKYKLNSIEELNSLGEIIGQTSEPSLLFEQYNEIDNVLDNFKNKDKIDAIWVLNTVESVSEFKKDSTFSFPKNLTNDGLATEEGIFSKTEIISDNEKIGVVILRSNLHQLENDINSLYTRIIFSSTTLLFLLSIVAFIVQNSISKPIISLSNVAREIKKGNLKLRAKVSSTDELNDLNEAFNQMIDQIIYEKQISDQILKIRGQFFSSIGKQVSEQTNELMLSVQEIQNENGSSQHTNPAFLEIQESANNISNSINDILVLTSKNERGLSIRDNQYSLEQLKSSILKKFDSEIKNRNIKFDFKNFIDQEFHIDSSRLLFVLKFLLKKITDRHVNETITINNHLHENFLNVRIQVKKDIEFINEMKVYQSILANKDKKIDIKSIQSFEELLIIRIFKHYQSTLITNSDDDFSDVSISFQLANTTDQVLSKEEEEVKLKDLTALVVEPNEKQHQLLVDLLSKYQIKTISARTADDLFDLVKYNNSSIDIIISEEDLPKSTASGTFKNIMDELEHCPPVIIYSSNSDEETVRLFQKINIQTIFSKPIHEITLVKKISELVS